MYVEGLCRDFVAHGWYNRDMLNAVIREQRQRRDYDRYLDRLYAAYPPRKRRGR